MSDESANGDGAEVHGIHGASAGIFGTHIAEMLFRKHGVDPWVHNREELLTVVEAVAASYAAMERQRRVGWHGDGPDSHVNRTNRLIEFLRDGGLMSDLFEDDDECRYNVLMLWDDVIATLTKKTNTTKPSHIPNMTQLDWFRLDQAVDSGERPGRGLARELHLAPSSVQNLYVMYERAGRVGAHRLHG